MKICQPVEIITFPDDPSQDITGVEHPAAPRALNLLNHGDYSGLRAIPSLSV